MIECIRFNPQNKHTLLGFADVKVVKWGLLIYGISLHQKDGKRWISLPSKQYEKDGEKKWMTYIRMENPEHQKEFLKQIQDAILAKMNELVAFENRTEFPEDSFPDFFAGANGIRDDFSKLSNDMKKLGSKDECLF